MNYTTIVFKKRYIQSHTFDVFHTRILLEKWMEEKGITATKIEESHAEPALRGEQLLVTFDEKSYLIWCLSATSKLKNLTLSVIVYDI
jgi:hypothetical protein